MNDIYWPTHIEIIKNRYYYAYLKLIVRAKLRNYQNLNYYEKHHIIPRSFGGRDTQINFAYLTAKEHYLAHRFLTKFTVGAYQYKMLYALDAMGMKSKDTIHRWRMPARVYEYNRLQISLRGHSEETKRKIGLANKGRSPVNKGIPRSEEIRLKISKGHLGKKGPPASNKVKEAASTYHSNAKWINNGKINKRILASELYNYSNWELGRLPVKKSKTKSSVWISNPTLQKRLRVTDDVLETYLSNGWIKGRSL